MILKSWVLGHQLLPDSHTHPTNMDSGVSQVYLMLSPSLELM